MCLYPLSIRNPTKVVHTGGGQLLRMQVPCGHCAQCLQAKRNEWYIRTHYEMLHTFAQGGFVYFDTLTYRDKDIPRLSHFIDIDKYGLKDFTCFNHRHFKLFLKRLRRIIAYRYKVVKDAFRYFLTTEYGEDDRFTHRPHFHILFFVYFKVDPLEFSKMVADCWQYGRTDGFPYKPATYVHNHVYGCSCYIGKFKDDNGLPKDVYSSDNIDFTSVTAVCMYVSKYITKSSKFVKTLNARLATLREKVTEYDKLNKSHVTEESENMLKELRRSIDMFHRQSKGFGLSYLYELTPEKLMFLNDDKVLMKDKDKICRSYPLPMYYKRKLYYTLLQHDDGTYYWQATDNGIQHILDVKLKSIDKTCIKYMDIVRNCSNSQLVKKFFDYLGARDISDYVIYEKYYKGRHRHPNGINYKTQLQKPLTDEEFNLHGWSACVRDAMRPYDTDCVTLALDETLLRSPVCTKEEIEEQRFEMYKHGHDVHMLNASRSDTIDNYIRLYVIDENTDPMFADFDKMAVLIIQMTEEQRNEQQITFDFLEDLKERYKLIFNKSF